MPPDPSPRPPSADWVRSALAEMGVATITADGGARVLRMNTRAEALTGWSQREAVGLAVGDVFRIEHEGTRRPVADPVADVLAGGSAAGLSGHTVLTDRGGKEWRIDHGTAPVRDAAGTLVGAVLIFCDVGDRQRAVQELEDARAFAESVIQTVREPLVILDADLRVRTANPSYYRTFRVTAAETEGQFFFTLGNRQWGAPRLRQLLEQVLAGDPFDDFAVDHVFETLGRRSMVLNARRLVTAGRPALVLLAVEDATERLGTTAALARSETRYRRLFETAQDGILLVNPDTRRIFDANPFLVDLLGYPRAGLVGKELWEIGLFHDIDSNKRAFRTLQESGYIRYDDLPLRTHDGRGIEVEFVSNVYAVGDARVIQCNVRDVTDRKRAEDALRAAYDGLEIRVEERTAELAQANASLWGEIARREGAEADRRDLQQRLATAHEDERRRIARELHDQTGQDLAALGLGLKVVKDATPDPSPERDRLHALQALTDRIGREVHTLALEVRPTALDDHGLPAALANYADGWSERTGVAVDFHGPAVPEDRLPSPVETALYRVVLEALANVHKHAAARRVSVVLRRTPTQAAAVVEDDGRGFDADADAVHRLGILGMRERMALVDGTLAIESDPGRTTVIARAPLPGHEQGARRD